jgi:hypothetical protein
MTPPFRLPHEYTAIDPGIRREIVDDVLPGRVS